MTAYRLSPEAQDDLRSISDYIVEQAGAEVARRTLSEIRKGMNFLAATPGAGHHRRDLTHEPVKFWSVLSYLIVYDPVMKPMGVVRGLHGRRNIETILGDLD